jgi:hypothetical protein
VETAYTMIGSDGQQYGPVALAQIKSWISEGRIGPETKILRSDTQSWLPAGQYSELGLAPAPAAPPPPIGTSPTPVSNAPLERRARVGASWFYAIAVLSLINSAMAMSSSGAMFIAGLAVARKLFDFSDSLGSGGTTVAFVLSAVASGMFAVFGFFAGKRHSWSYIAGMVLYGLDALLYVFDGFWLGVAFHVFVLFRLFRGLQACQQLTAPGARS